MASEKELFASLESKYRLPQGYLNRLYQLESSSGTNLRTEKSSAKGPFQFTDDTAKRMGLKDPDNLEASADAAARLAVQNRTILQQNGVENPDGKVLYLAHQQGAPGALKLLKGGNDAADALVGKDAVTNNSGKAGDTAKTFAEQVMGKYEGADSAKLEPYSALKTSAPLDTLNTLEGESADTTDKGSSQRSALAMNLLSSVAAPPKAAPMMDIPDLSKPKTLFAEGGLASLPKPSMFAIPPEQPAAAGKLPPPDYNRKTGLMYPVSIILRSLQTHGMSKDNANAVVVRIAVAAKADKIRFVQLGNTVFVFNPKPDKSAEFSVFSVEPRRISDRLVVFQKTLKSLGFRKMTTIAPESQAKYADVIAGETKIPYKKTKTRVTVEKKPVDVVRYEFNI